MEKKKTEQDGSQNRELVLKVMEAALKDVGRGIARIDPKDMETLGVDVGDIVHLEGNRATVAKIMPAFAADRGKSIIQIDGLIRGNSQASLDKKVTVSKVGVKPATKIHLGPGDMKKPMSGRGDARYLGRLLEGLPLVAGDTVRATMFGARSHDFVVRSTTPAGPVLVHSTTMITVKEEKEGQPKALKIAYEDVGGLRKEIQRVREMIELPLKYPEVFERLGIEAPKGVLLYGPPGTGKTLIARAVANETEATFIHFNGPEIMAKFYGESEAKLRGIFEEAKDHAPAIIFLDEIDAIAPKREEMGGEKQVERRIVAQLLALLDGLESRGEIIVIAATNIPNTIDPALRRPGRFDREMEIGIPDVKGRLEILQIHSRGMPLADDVEMERISRITHGYVGADLEALCREAAMACLRTIFPNIDFTLEDIPYEQILELEVSMDHFKEALRMVEPSAIREVFVDVPNVGWDDIGGLAEVKREFEETVQWPLKHPDLFELAKTKPVKGILLSGPPGTGKTLMAKALAHESEVNFISVKGPELMSKWIGSSEKGVREVFKKAKQASPCIVFFDEIDSLAPARGGGGDSGVTQRIVSQFLTELDGLEELKGVLVLAATNRKDILDPALLRPGRFDSIIELPFPDEEARLAIFKIHTRGKPLAKDVDLTPMARDCDDLTGAHIEAICHKASSLAIREFLGKNNPDKKDYKGFVIRKKHFLAALEMVVRSTS